MCIFCDPQSLFTDPAYAKAFVASTCPCAAPDTVSEAEFLTWAVVCAEVADRLQKVSVLVWIHVRCLSVRDVSRFQMVLKLAALCLESMRMGISELIISLPSYAVCI